ncbi:hypothetical protein [Legionella sp. W05-934-2]|uniref:hypothetical protein n=1 Tax=Legionella sp. W05-934-2 TaxID=1198649 RepID=UPI0034621A08
MTNQQKKPDLKKNFFENYSDHLESLKFKFLDTLKQNVENGNDLSDVMFTGSALLLDPKHLLILDALRDGHDYLDEVVGATVVPIVGALASLAAFGLGIYEGAQSLAIQSGLVKDDKKDHGNKAINYLAASGLALVVSVVSLIKSVLSLVTRPIITLMQGWKPQDTVRFYNENSAKGQFDKGLEKAGRVFDDVITNVFN